MSNPRPRELPPKNGTYRVLLIQEDPKQTELYSDMIREVAECQVDVISQAESSLEWVGRFNYHLVVIDVSTSQTADRAVHAFNALGLLETIKRITPGTSVILISDRATVEEAVAAVRLGAEDYLKKPFNLESFRLAVKRGLDRKMIFGESSGASGYLNLLNSCQMISASLEQSKIFGIVQSYFARELHSDHTAIYTRGGDGTPSQIEEASVDLRKDRAMEEILGIALQASGALSHMSAGGEAHRFIERGQLTPGLFIFHFRCVGTQDYYCVCLSPQRPSALESFESRLKMLRTQIELTGKNIEQYLGVQHLVYVDDATGLYNTRYLHNILDREISQAQHSKKSFAILFIDGDKFKSINDTHGHLTGTKLLNELGAQLRGFVREKDTVFRYGGDEFVAVLSACDLATAQAVAERIRQSVERHTFCTSDGKSIKITVSIGVALFPDHADSKKAVIEAADHAMYTAKRSTRNSVFIAPLAPKPEAPVTDLKKAKRAKKDLTHG